MSVPAEALPSTKCGICNKYLSFFPIFVGENDLTICGRCSEVLPENEQSTRDLAYERFAQFFQFPCIYENKGCIEKLHPSEVPDHEQICPFREICCPMDCMWQGPVNELCDHFQESHPQSILRDGEFEMDFLNSYENFTLLIHNDELFSFKRKFDHAEGVLQCSLFCYQVIDPTIKYSYEIKVQNIQRTLYECFPEKSAQNFMEQNITEITVEKMRNKLNDPMMMIGTVKVFETKKKVCKKPVKTVPNPEINLEMLRELECPVCFDYITPPIFQCVTGHSICAECKTKVHECPTCKQEIKNTQNFTLEKMAYFLVYPCKFSEYGCDFASKPVAIKQHQKFCLHGPHHCPLEEYEKCNWKNSAKNIYPHIFEKHHDSIIEIDTVNVFLDKTYFDTKERVGYILKFSNALFKLHYLYKDCRFNWAMQFIGPSEEAENYRFEIDIIDNGNKNRRLFLRNICAPLTLDNEAFIEENSYVYISLDQIRPFIPGELLSYRIRLLK